MTVGILILMIGAAVGIVALFVSLVVAAWEVPL